MVDEKINIDRISEAGGGEEPPVYKNNGRNHNRKDYGTEFLMLYFYAYRKR